MRFLTTNFKDLLLLAALIITVGYLQYNILSPHIKYGFADVDWIFLYRFKNLPPFSLGQIISEWQASGVYAYQTYYIGLQSIFFGVDYEKFHTVTNIFKFLSTITLYPLLVYLTKNKTFSFITTLIYGITYPSIGAMYTVVTSGIYFAVFVLNIFLLLYTRMVFETKKSLSWYIAIAILYFVALFFSTERLYPLIPIIILAELFCLWRKKFPRFEIKHAIFRLSIVLAPLLLMVIYKPYAQNNAQFFYNTGLLYNRIMEGNWHLLLIPFSVLGSLFLPGEYWRYLGIVDVTDFNKYHNFYLFNPFIVFSVITILLAFAASKKRILFIALTLVPTYLLAISSYFLVTNRLLIPETLRMHYDPHIYLHSALFGQFILCLCLSFLVEWIIGNYKNRLVFSMFFGPFLAFVFIFLTWLPAEPGLVFSNVHRYLTVPAIGSSVFISIVICLIFLKLQTMRFIKHFSYLVFLAIFPIIVMNSQVLATYFKGELDFTGMRGSEHLKMKGKFVSFLGDFEAKEPAVFFVDSLGDTQNGYFHETTVLAGFHYWMMFRNRPDPDIGVFPDLVRHDFLCLKTDCLEEIKKMVTEKDGKKGIQVAKIFYPENRVYFLKLNNRDVFFTQNEMKQKLGLK